MSALNTFEFPLSKQTCIVIDQFITVQAAAEASGYNVQYMRRLLRAGKLDSIKVGQVWLIKLDSLKAYMNWSEQKDDQRCGPKGSQIVQSSTSVNTNRLHPFTNNKKEVPYERHDSRRRQQHYQS